MKGQTEEKLEKKCLDLIQANKFSYNNLKPLIECLDSQISSTWFSNEINTGILRIIQFYPQKNVEGLYEKLSVKILLKSINQFPKANFLQNLLLLPKIVYNSDNVQKIVKLGQLLESSAFEKFWGYFSEIKGFVEQSYPSFEIEVKEVIVKQTSTLFSNLGKDQFSRYLNGKVEPSELFAESKESDTFTFQASEYNTPRKQEEERLTHLKLSNLQPLL
eukprot:snap_masked-scaffold_90-processed-gene-0.33-mRNA-1 protein AED:1.00 eAED:1.00 QI:0/-1/0/0/-1/1/1/0/217